MFYQKALPKLWFVSRVNSLLTNGDEHRCKLAATFKKLDQQILLMFAWPLCGEPIFV